MDYSDERKDKKKCPVLFSSLTMRFSSHWHMNDESTVVYNHPHFNLSDKEKRGKRRGTMDSGNKKSVLFLEAHQYPEDLLWAQTCL